MTSVSPQTLSSDPLQVHHESYELLGLPTGGVETTPVPSAVRSEQRWQGRSRWAVLSATVILLIVAGLLIGYRQTAVQPVLRVETDSPGTEVLVDGTARGWTPLTLALAAGSHDIRVRDGSREATFTAVLASGDRAVYHVPSMVETPVLPQVPESTGSVSVATDAPGASVAIDGVERGVSPLVLDNLAAGDHEVVVRSMGSTYRRTVRVEPGARATLVVGTAAAAPGWLTVSTPLPLRIYKGTELVGTTEARIMLPAGMHALEFAEPSLGFQTRRMVRIEGNQTTTVAIALPEAPLSVNATPWAQVWVDGRHVGDTPLANVMVAVGAHQITLRHPQLGEKRVQTVVVVGKPNRVSATMTEQ